jgi:hypothetical protein
MTSTTRQPRRWAFTENGCALSFEPSARESAWSADDTLTDPLTLAVMGAPMYKENCSYKSICAPRHGGSATSRLAGSRCDRRMSLRTSLGRLARSSAGITRLRSYLLRSFWSQRFLTLSPTWAFGTAFSF